MPDVGYHPDNYCWKHYCFEYRLATPPASPAENDRDSIEAALQRLADFDTSENESEDK